MVKIFIKGMDWSGIEAGKASSLTKPATADDIKKQADQLIKDALKSLPQGL